MKQIAWVLVALLVVGCASRVQPPKAGGADPPKPVTSVCKEGNSELSLAGVKPLDPAGPVLARFGHALDVKHSAKYPMMAYTYAFGAVSVWGSDKIYSIDLNGNPSAQQIGDLWPDVQFGADRETTLQVLARMGICPATSTASQTEFSHAGVRLTLSFDDDQKLQRAFLTLDTPPDATQGDPTTHPAGFYPPDVKTGIPEVDRVIQALATADGDALAELVKLSKFRCTASVYDGGPVCPPGTPVGSPIDMFPSGSCEPNLLPADLVHTIIRSVFAKPQYVYAAWSAEAETSYGAKYGVIFGPGFDGSAVKLYLDQQGLIVASVACGAAANMMPKAATFILPPNHPELG